MKKIVVTGSHPTPAQAFIAALPGPWPVVVLGEADSPKLKRYDVFGSLRDFFRLPGWVSRFRADLKRIGPDVVVSFGGYPAVPVCWAARLLGIPIVIHEQTFGAGLASKLTALVADKVAISWNASRKHFAGGKTVLTGNPIRRDILAVKRAPKNALYFCGGHQGAQVLNQALAPLLPRLLKKFTVYHQYGRQPRPHPRPGYVAKEYFGASELKKIYAAAALVVGRSGINTVTELAFLKIPALLIPLPYTQKNEQLINARFLESLGLARILTQDKLTGDNLMTAIDTAVTHLPVPSKIAFDREQIAQAAARLVELVAATSRAGQ